MTKNIRVNPLSGDRGAFSFMRTPIEESLTSKPDATDVVYGEGKTGFFSAVTIHEGKHQKERCFRRGPRGKRG